MKIIPSYFPYIKRNLLVYYTQQKVFRVNRNGIETYLQLSLISQALFQHFFQLLLLMAERFVNVLGGRFSLRSCEARLYENPFSEYRESELDTHAFNRNFNRAAVEPPLDWKEFYRSFLKHFAKFMSNYVDYPEATSCAKLVILNEKPNHHSWYGQSDPYRPS